MTGRPTDPLDVQPNAAVDLIGRAIRHRIARGLPIFNEKPNHQRRPTLQLPMNGAMAIYEGRVLRVMTTTHGANDHPSDFTTLNPPPMQHELQMTRCVTPDDHILEILDDDAGGPGSGETSPGSRNWTSHTNRHVPFF